MPAQSISLTSPLFLIGFMGCGKSHWGSAWAQRHKLVFIDLDLAVEKHEAASITEIFENNGEEYFREKETQMLRNIKAQNTLVACGGGTPCFYNNIDWMNEHGSTILLQASPQFLLKNIMGQEGRRPLIKKYSEAELLLFIGQKLEEREQFYSKANVIVNAETATEQTIDQFLK